MTKASEFDWEGLGAVLEKPDREVSAKERRMAVWFLEATPAEDEWLKRSGFIDGSPALLMRSMLAERGTLHEHIAACDLYRVRPALFEFAAGKPFPRDLIIPARVSLKYWKDALLWGENIIEGLKRIGVIK